MQLLDQSSGSSEACWSRRPAQRDALGESELEHCRDGLRSVEESDTHYICDCCNVLECTISSVLARAPK